MQLKWRIVGLPACSETILIRLSGFVIIDSNNRMETVNGGFYSIGIVRKFKLCVFSPSHKARREPWKRPDHVIVY